MFTLEVYLDDGRVFQQDVNSPDKVREYTMAIIKTGYRFNDGIVFEHYPPHRILKVKSYHIPTETTDKVRGT